MYFSEKALKQMRDEYSVISEKHQRLFESYLVRNYKTARAKEYAEHGFSRRLNTLVRCIDKVFEILPPDRVDIPTRQEVIDASINIQAFIFNVFGCTDNLAWIWVLEKNLTKNDGSPIPNHQVGLSRKYELVRKSLTPELQKYLNGVDDWFDYLENFRHALAHRIPLYIPPYVVTTDNEAAYKTLEDHKMKASQDGDLEEYDRLSAEQMGLVKFRPWMTHSFQENAKPVVFHAQLLADFKTIEELGRKILEGLNRN